MKAFALGGWLALLPLGDSLCNKTIPGNYTCVNCSPTGTIYNGVWNATLGPNVVTFTSIGANCGWQYMNGFVDIRRLNPSSMATAIHAYLSRYFNSDFTGINASYSNGVRRTGVVSADCSTFSWNDSTVWEYLVTPFTSYRIHICPHTHVSCQCLEAVRNAVRHHFFSRMMLAGMKPTCNTTMATDHLEPETYLRLSRTSLQDFWRMRRAASLTLNRHSSNFGLKRRHPCYKNRWGWLLLCIYVPRPCFRSLANTPAAQVRGLVASRQLVFANGGWSMHDESSPTFVDM